MTRNAARARPHWALALVVLLAHGAALWGWSRPSLPGALRTQSQRGGLIRIHVVPISDAMPPATGPSLEAMSPELPSMPAPEPPAPRVARSNEAPTHKLAPEGADGALEEYLPRNRLSVAPQVLTSVDVQFPPDVSGIVNLKTQITLFVDEQGAVRRLRFDTAGIPSSFAAAVLDTFLKARFKPGEVNGVAVRSQIRLEVEFRANRGS